MVHVPDAPITPWPLPASATRVLIVGGTFDPPHAGHVDLAIRARDRWHPAAHAIFVPAGVSPFKSGDTPPTPSRDRVAMLRLALEGRERTAIWTDEIDRHARDREPTYTIDTLRRARIAAGHTPEFRLLIGADQAAQFHRWREARAILPFAPPIVIPRDPIATRGAFRATLHAAAYWSPAEIDAWSQAWSDVGVVPASATEIRDAVRTRGVSAVPSAWLSPGVASYIEREHLYRT